MAEIIGLSGPQGGGKSTLLNGLISDGIVVDDFKVSRAVQERLGWQSLERVLDSVETMKMFQQTILDVKYDHEIENLKRKDAEFILVERTFADIASYTQLWSWELVHEHKWSVGAAMKFCIPFIEECAHSQHVYSANLFLPYMPHIKWQNDPHRAAQKHTTFIHEQLVSFFGSKNTSGIPVFEITESGVDERVTQVKKFLETLYA